MFRLKKKLPISNLFVIVVLVFSSVSSIAANPSNKQMVEQSIPYGNYVPDRLLVKLKDGVTQREALSLSLSVLSAEPLYKYKTAQNSQIYLLHLMTGSDVITLVRIISTDPRIVWVEPDYIAMPASNIQVIPDDPYYPTQWGISKINAETAWDVNTGDSSVIIAILDSGIQTDHPDLQSRLWANPGEIPGNGIDDDNNMFIDDVEGWNFVSDNNNPADDNGHGTQVAGVAVAATDNATGIAGTCWECLLMPVKVMSAGGVANYSDIAAGTVYSAIKGADIINISLGGYSYSNALKEAVQTAVNTYGSLVIAGAGNDNRSSLFYPAAYEEVLAVASTDQDDLKAPFSNYGSWVDLSAPGVDITTTYMGGDYGTVEGTSFSSPFVSGVAGLVISENLSWNPTLVRAQLTHTADLLDTLNPAYAGLLGSGRLNAESALTTEPSPVLEISSRKINGDPLGKPVPGQSSTLEVTLSNTWLDADNVSGELTTSDAYVLITQGVTSFEDIPSGGTGISSPLFNFDVAYEAGYDHNIPFTLEVSANNGDYIASIDFIIKTRSAEEQVSGTIGSDTTWTNDKTYVVMANVGVAPGVTLTIQAGTTIEFNGNFNLNVGGRLIADGTDVHPIRFTEHNGVSWGRIYFDDSSVDATADISGTYQSGNILRWVVMEGTTQGIECNKATPYLSHLTTDGGGMNCQLGGTTLWMLDSNLAGNVFISENPNGRGRWNTRTPMPTARAYIGITAANDGKIFVFGGSELPDDDVVFDTVEAYDPHTDTWETKTSMPTARTCLGVVTASNGKMYAIGGWDGTKAVDTVEEYDPVTDTWTTRASMPTARYGHGVAAANNGRIYAIGGWPKPFNYLNTVEEYDPQTDSWTTKSPMPKARVYFGIAAASNNKIYAIGGYDGSHINYLEEYDPLLDIWTTKTDMPTSRVNLGASAIDDEVIAVGGWLHEGPVDKVEKYSPSINSWTTLLGMPAARFSLGVQVSTNNRIYAIGGRDLTEMLDTVEEFSLDAHNAVILRSNIQNGYLVLPGESLVQESIIANSLMINGEGAVKLSTIVSGGVSIIGGSVEETQIIGGVTIQNRGIIQDSKISDGGILISSGSVLTNTISGGVVNAGSGSEIRGNVIEDSPTWGIQSGYPSSIIKNRLVDNTAGIQTWGGVVQGNLIANSTEVGIEINGDSTVISNTLIGNTGSTIKLNNGINVEITGNNLEGNLGTYDIENLTATDVPAQNNWWGTTDTIIISQRIFDYHDDYTKGEVIFQPVSTDSIHSAPAYVRNVILDPESPVGIETVNFEVEFSSNMEIEYLPKLTFRSMMENPWVVYNTQNSGLPSNAITSITVDPDRSFWIGTGSGVAYLQNSEWKIYDTSNSGLPNNIVWEIVTDPDDSHWFATEGGVAHYDGTTWVVYNTSNSELPSDHVVAIARDNDNSHWFGTVYGGVAHYDGANWTIYNTSNSGLPNNQITSIYTDPDGSHWFGTWGGGVAHFKGNEWIVYGPSQVYDISFDLRDSSHWFAVWGGGASHFDGTTWTFYNQGNSGLSSDLVHSIFTDPDGTTWFGTFDGGVSKFDGKNWIVYTSENSDIPSGEIKGIARDQDGSHWFGSADEGVGGLILLPVYSEFINPSWSSERNFLLSYEINSLIMRGDYRISVTSAYGMDGVEIAPNSAYTFTIDYAGGIGDTTPPITPVVIACGADTPDTLSAQWFTSDPDSEITLFKYSIGSTPGSGDVINWMTTIENSFVRNELNLIEGQTYFVTVHARNSGGLWSEAGISTGVVAGSGTCPLADFSADILSGQSPLIVNFTDLSQGDITEWYWDFGDGYNDRQQNPTHLYETTGVYTVTLLISGPGGSDLEIKPHYISVTPGQPVADFSASPKNGYVPLMVTFTDHSTGEITDWLWDFGDGITSTQQNPVHLYDDVGTYSVVLSVSGPGGTDLEVKPEYITVIFPKPGADFTGDPLSGYTPLSVTYTDQSTGEITDWMWDFGDGYTSTQQNPSHIYNDVGQYTVTLQVTGPGGSDIEVKTNYITVTPIFPIADFTADPRSGVAPLAVSFTDTSTGNITNWMWDFGDGENSSEQNPMHVYTGPGLYTVALFVSGPAGSDLEVKNTYIIVFPDGSFYRIFLAAILKQ